MVIPLQAIDYQQAYDQLLKLVKPSAAVEELTRHKVVGRVLAEDIFSNINVPDFAMSAMDGIAVKFTADVELEVSDTRFAGDTLLAGTDTAQAIRIMTGAAVPDGFDQVIPLEDVHWLESNQRLKLDAKPAKSHIKAIGSDIQKGQLLFKKGHCFTAKDLALLASVGISKVSVFKKTKVLVVLSGNELKTSSDTDTQTGKTFEANADWLTIKLEALGCELVDCLLLEDDFEQISKTLESYQNKVDLIISVGGASTGDKDFVQPIMQQWAQEPQSDRGGRGRFSDFFCWKINMKPAKPLSVLKTENLIWLALPGNPLACFMSFQLFAAPVIKKMQNQSWTENPSCYLPMAEALHNPTDKLVWQLVRLDNQGAALQKIDVFSSSHLISLSQADGYIALPPKTTLQANQKQAFWRFV